MLSNHFHFIVEAESNDALSRGVQGLSIRVAKALNRHWHRTGKVFRERFFATALRTMKSMRRALVYVLHTQGSAVSLSRLACTRHPTFELVLLRRIGLGERPGSRWNGSSPT